MNPHERTWNIVEHFFHKEQMPFYETIMTIGNGYLGTRATFEEGHPDELASTLVHGIFNHHPNDLVPDLANVPAWFALYLEIDGDVFHMNTGKVRGFERRLDLRDGVLQRQVLWQSPAGQVVSLQFERFASLANPHILAQKVTVKALSDIQSLKITAYLDESKAKNFAFSAQGLGLVSHWTDGETGAMNANDCWWQSMTGQSNYKVRLMQQVMIDAAGERLTATQTAHGMGNALDELSLKNGDSLTLYRIVSIATSRDTAELSAFTTMQLEAAVTKGYETLKAENKAAWEKLWEDMDIEIEGDEFAQLAIRFATYHLLIAAPYRDERVSIGAKTLSGPGYKGHVFWDTELFMLPPFTVSLPPVARNLLKYRYNNLTGAREKAAEAGYKGAMFPWESTDTGKETTPRWTLPDEKGNRIRIWTGDNEQHISSDIAYSLWQFWQWTGDDAFMRDYGAEIILDTAVFWESRVEWKEAAGRYELSQQIGPDEFHENIDNSVYTNRLVVWHLEHALKTLDWLQTHHPENARALTKQLGISEDTPHKWHDIIAKMYIPRNAERNVYEQFDGYFQKNVVDVPSYKPRTTNLDVILGQKTTHASQVIKQADVVMLIALLGEALGNHSELMRNWDAYLPNTAHDSSLSPAIYAWVGARLGLTEIAYELWVKAAGIDLNNNKGNVRDGIHAAACGGLREALLFGFAGLQLDAEKGWRIDPKLPAWWKSMAFSFYFRGKKHHIRIQNPS